MILMCDIVFGCVYINFLVLIRTTPCNTLIEVFEYLADSDSIYRHFQRQFINPSFFMNNDSRND